ncbi:MAG TPA: hypothetical protein VJO53_15290 [Candidatus Acidoferrales bacterium]|nr:hypothetical protein [Candidatus Acidoferrales bacterium]
MRGLKTIFAGTCLFVSFAFPAWAQDAEFLPEKPRPMNAAVHPRFAGSEAKKTGVHSFYDRAGKVEFGAALGLAIFDAAQTCHNLSNGGEEFSLPTQHCPNAVAMLLSSIALQEFVTYEFHSHGHHTLERMTRFQSMAENLTGIVRSKLAGAW